MTTYERKIACSIFRVLQDVEIKFWNTDRYADKNSVELNKISFGDIR